jgi:hypothetical protein
MISGSYNNRITVIDAGTDMRFSTTNFSHYGDTRDTMNPQEAADHFWKEFTLRLQD